VDSQLLNLIASSKRSMAAEKMEGETAAMQFSLVLLRTEAGLVKFTRRALFGWQRETVKQ